MDELERARTEEDLRNDVNQLKEQMSQILEILQSTERQRDTQVTSGRNGEGPDTHTHPPSLTPNMRTPNMPALNPHTSSQTIP